MSGWALTQTNVTKGTIVHVGGGNGYSIGVGTGMDVTDNYVVVLFPGKRWVYTSTTVSSGWHLFTLALAPDGTPNIYLDGTPVGTYPGVAATTPTSQISIGRNLGDEPGGQADRTFNSSVDDGRNYHRMLSTTEIQNLYTAGAQ